MCATIAGNIGLLGPPSIDPSTAKIIRPLVGKPEGPETKQWIHSQHKVITLFCLYACVCVCVCVCVMCMHECMCVCMSVIYVQAHISTC